MIKRLIHTFGVMAVMLVVFTACQEHDVPVAGNEKDVPEGYVAISFKLDIPEMKEVQVRAVDPDGVDIHNLYLYCFNTYGLYIGKIQADITPATGTTGTFEATIPEDTQIIHFLANQNANLYDDDVLRGKSEEEVIAAMEGASGMLVYWGYFKYNPDNTELKTIQAQIAAKGTSGIQMIRNQAMVTMNMQNPHTYTYNNESGSFTVTGFRTTNIHAFGTVAPFCPTHGFNMSTWPCDGEGAGFVTLPINLAIMSDIEEVNTKAEDYVFEHENTLENPVSVIIRGRHNGESVDKYYRVMLVDSDGNQLLVRRNHKYTIRINGPLSYGQDSFAAAIEAPATNNVWISVDAWVNEISDENYTLTVEKTSVVLDGNKDVVEGKELELKYSLLKVNGEIDTTVDLPEVTWLEGNTVAYNDFSHQFTQDNQNAKLGNGTITIKLRGMTHASQHVGTLMIRKGRLFRTIEVIVIHTQKFTPSWISAQVYGTVTGDENTRENVTLKFTIPETCPESLYPFPVLISVNSLDIRSEAGNSLPVVVKGSEQYFGTDYEGIEYKYLYMVEKPGVQRVYFENILSHKQDEKQTLHLEAKYFETLTKTVVYADHQRTINLLDLQEYNWHQTTDDGTDFAEDEVVLYRLVPQKINAPVAFTMQLKNGDTPANAGEKDEFLLYSKTLNYYMDTEVSAETLAEFDCTFEAVDEEHWSSNGRVHMFYPREGKLVQNPTGEYSIYLYTNTSQSGDVIRIASNTSLSKAFRTELGGADGAYMGNSYRSVIFELANYHPFHFNAQVKGDGTGNKGVDTDEEEVVTHLSWDYAAPGVSVPIKFQTGTFIGSDGATVNPFGTEYKVYIDAPMLALDGTQTNVSDEGNGRFSYTVPADATATTHDEITVNFKTKSICNSGEITISSETDKVVYYSKTFKISNNKITGTVGLDTDSDGEVEEQLPNDAFIAFIRNKTNTRIGAIIVTCDSSGNSHYSLNLRSEYVFDWTDEVTLSYKHTDGKYYEYQTTLNQLATDTDKHIVLTLAD